MFYKNIERLPIYNSYLFQIIVSDETEKINKHIGQKYDYYYGVCIKTKHNLKKDTFDKGITIVLNPNCYSNKITAGIIAHECIHVKNMIFKSIGYKPKRDNDEAEAYFVDYLVNKVTNFYNKSIKHNESNTKDI
jgi:hypothetical protein